MIEDYLSIVVITYNRAKLLDRTLQNLLASKLKNVPITILNNASPDNTLQVCEKYSSLPNVKIVTHKFNIGGDANTMRAYENAEKEYLWIMSDDDDYDFSDIDDFVDVIQSKKYDVIHLGTTVYESNWEFGGKSGPLQDIVKQGYNYFRLSSNIASSVVRVKLFDEYIARGYNNVVNRYPHMSILLGLYEKNADIYITKRPILKIVLGTSDNYTYYDFLRGWICTSKLLQKKSDRHRFILSQFVEARSKVLAGCYLSFIKKGKPTFSIIKTLWMAMPWKNRLGSFFILPYRFFEVKKEIRKVKGNLQN